MNYEQNVFTHQYWNVNRFVHHLIYYRSLSKGYLEHQPSRRLVPICELP
jgi:hypothetical protein